MSSATPSESARPFADLLRAEAYPHRPARVELIETHISWVFLAGERVYKVKKPVDLGFLDYRSRERRRFYCEEEVRLNRRMAPEIYLGVVAIGRGPGGHLAVGAEGEPAEPAVEMHRLPAEGMLPAMVSRGAVGPREIESLAQLLAGFHRDARRDHAVAIHGAPERVRFLCEENFAALLPCADVRGPAGTLVSRAELGRLRNATLAYLDERDALFRRRASERRIVEGHGDLHAGNLCFVGEMPIAFDAIEFAERFRCGDVACDLAFLTMDLKRLDQSELARELARRYAVLSGDGGLLELLPFYETYRALVRAKIAALRAGLPPHDHAAVAECRGYLTLALTSLKVTAETATHLPQFSTHREESNAMNTLFHFENYSLTETEREKLKLDLEALGRVVEPFPVKDLHVHIHRHPHQGDFHVKLDLHLPGQVLFTGERGANYHPAFTECSRQMIAKVKTYKDQLGHRREWPEARPEKA